MGPKGCVIFTPARVTSYRDFIGLDGELWEASFFYLANRGLLLPPGPDDQWTLSVQHREDEVDRYLEVFAEFAAEVSGAPVRHKGLMEVAFQRILAGRKPPTDDPSPDAATRSKGTLS